MTFFSPPLRRLFYACLAGAVLIAGARAVNAEPVGAGATVSRIETVRSCPRCIVKPHGEATRGIIAVASRYLGARNPTGQRGPWCGHFVNLVLRQAGYRPMPGNRAVDGLRAGTRLPHAVPGALIIRRHHVEIALGDGRSISGNWGGRVAIHPTSRGVRCDADEGLTSKGEACVRHQ